MTSVLFIAENSLAVGFGHLSRCMDLAEYLLEFKIKSHFRGIAPESRKLFGDRLAAFDSGEELDHPSIPCIGIVKKYCLVVVDGYSYASDIEGSVLRLISALDIKTAAITDVGEPLTSAFLTIDPNFRITTKDLEGFYSGINQIPFRKSVRERRYKPISPRITKSKRICIFLYFSDASDPDGQLECRALDELFLRSNIPLDIVVWNPRTDLDRYKELAGDVVIRRAVKNTTIEGAVVGADIALISMGRIMFEAAYMGTPSVVITVSDLQLAYAKSIKSINVFRFVDRTQISSSLVDQVMELANSDKLEEARNLGAVIFAKRPGQRTVIDTIVKITADCRGRK